MTTVRALSESDIPEAAQVVARSFRNNTAMVAVLERDEAERVRLLTLFALHLLPAYLTHGRCWVLCEDQNIRAVMLTLPPGRFPLPWTVDFSLTAVSLWHGGLSTTKRFIKIDGFVKAQHPERPHHYLYMLATDAGHQGRGFGSQLLTTLREHAGGTEIYLETDEERNLRFYQRNGYLIRGELPAPIGSPAFPLWFLHRDPPHQIVQ